MTIKQKSYHTDQVSSSLIVDKTGASTAVEWDQPFDLPKTAEEEKENLSLLFSIPENGNTSAGLHDVPLLGFSEPIETDTVTSESVFLSSPIGSVSGKLHVSDTMVSFVPDRPLVWGTKYVFHASTAVKGITGKELDRSIQINFNTRPLHWDAPRVIQKESGRADNPALALDELGNAFAIWREGDGTGHVIKAARYDGRVRKWGPSEEIQYGPSDSDGPQVAVDPMGNAIAVWAQQEGFSYRINATRYDFGAKEWSRAKIIQDGSGDAHTPQIAIDAFGNAIAVWKQKTSCGFQISASHYDATKNDWSRTYAIQHVGSESYAPQVAVNALGDAVVVWQVADEQEQSILAARYDADADKWDEPYVIQHQISESYAPQVAIDGAGNAIAVWAQENASCYQIMAAHYSMQSKKWNAPCAIQREVGDSFAPHIAIDAKGNAIVIWIQSDGTLVYRVVAARYDVAQSSWGVPVCLQIRRSNSYAPQISMDAAGNAIALWTQKDGANYHVHASRYSAETASWDEPQVIQGGTSSCVCPRISANSSGCAIAAWLQSGDRGYYISANTFSAITSARLK